MDELRRVTIRTRKQLDEWRASATVFNPDFSEDQLLRWELATSESAVIGKLVVNLMADGPFVVEKIEREISELEFLF
jgi:hypothetical protein